MELKQRLQELRQAAHELCVRLPAEKVIKVPETPNKCLPR